MDEPQPPQHSAIPQFLLDTRHPWIIKHQSVLERLPDVNSFLYSPPGTRYRTPTSPGQLPDQQHDASGRPATTDDELDLHPHLDLEVPADLFSSLCINNALAHTHRAGWPNAHGRLLELQRCPPATLARVRSLDVTVRVLASGEGLGAEEWQDLEGPAGDELLRLFASVLAAMTGLERLQWRIPHEFAPRWREGLVGALGLRLPSVRRLEVAPFCEYMVDSCPNVEVLECNGLDSSGKVLRRGNGPYYVEVLAEAAEKLPKVKEFSLPTANVTPSLISAMAKSMPRLVCLSLGGYLPRPPPIKDPETRERRAGPGGVRFKEILAVLVKFSDLEELHLPGPHDLNLTNIYAVERCGNSFLHMSEEDRINSNRIENRKELQVYEKAASMAVEALPQLKRLTIGDVESTITHGEDGKASASLPWSGRLDEYLDGTLVWIRGNVRLPSNPTPAG